MTVRLDTAADLEWLRTHPAPTRGGYTLYDGAGEWIARELDARTAYAMASVAVEQGHARIVETPDGRRRRFEGCDTDPAYRAYLAGGADPRD